MTTDDFSIEFEWLSRDYGSRLERATLAEIGIMAGGVYLTELEDLKSRIIRTRARLSGYDFALWLAGNWWRLCFEPPKEGLDWQLSHSTTSIGGGYSICDFRFAICDFKDKEYELVIWDRTKNFFLRTISLAGHRLCRRWRQSDGSSHPGLFARARHQILV